MDDETALVQTVDFFPPIVDDPYAFGQIAVSNALSDVYAMGGRPLTALNIVGFPAALPTQVTDAGAGPDDMLVLTKPLGTGIITTAGKQGVAPEEVLEAAVEIMSDLNRAASEAMTGVGVHACVDVTGFGLLGHLRGMTNASGVGAEIEFGSVPFIAGAEELAHQGVAPGGTHRNLSSVEPDVEWSASISEVQKLLLADAQTSGGLLIAVEPEKLDDLLAALAANCVTTRAVVGRITEHQEADRPAISVIA